MLRPPRRSDNSELGLSASIEIWRPAARTTMRSPSFGLQRVAPDHQGVDIERGLNLLRPKGVLGFICPDRWMRNQYGADLRELISGSYAVDTVITMHDVEAFEEEVSAYPAIVVPTGAPQRASEPLRLLRPLGERGRFPTARCSARTSRRGSRRGA